MNPSSQTRTGDTTAGEPMALELDDIHAGYGSSTPVLRGVSLEVPAGSVVALLGANGAGKTTLMRVASGLLRPSGGRRRLAGVDMGWCKSHALSRAGLCLVPEGRGIYRSLSVQENLALFGGDDADMTAFLARFPVLARRMKQAAGTMSGGEQQMLALGRAYLSRPKIVLLDEVSMGLSPVLVDEIFESIRDLKARGTSLLIVEQYVKHALGIADVVYVLSRGTILLRARPDELDHDALIKSYMHHDIDLEAVEASAAAGGAGPLGSDRDPRTTSDLIHNEASLNSVYSTDHE